MLLSLIQTKNYRIYYLISSTPFLVEGEHEVMVPRQSGFIREADLRSAHHHWLPPRTGAKTSTCGAALQTRSLKQDLLLKMLSEDM